MRHLNKLDYDFKSAQVLDAAQMAAAPDSEWSG
jgi:hypothetical protein